MENWFLKSPLPAIEEAPEHAIHEYIFLHRHDGQRRNFKSIKLFGNGYFLTLDTHPFFQRYILGNEDNLNPYLFHLQADSQSKMPETVILTGEYHYLGNG
jgi:acetyl esterase/lipase